MALFHWNRGVKVTYVDATGDEDGGRLRDGQVQLAILLRGFCHVVGVYYILPWGNW